MQRGSVAPHLYIINTSDVVLDGAVVVVVSEVENDEQLILFTCLLLYVVGLNELENESWVYEVLVH